MSEIEFAVIGGGLLGAPTAWRLAEMGRSVLLFAPTEPADYKTHDGVLASHYDQSRIARIVDPDPVRTSLAALAAPALAPFRVECGLLGVGPTDGDYVPALRGAGNEHDLNCVELSKRELAERFPYLRFEEQSAALLQERLAGYINPRTYIAAEIDGLDVVAEQVVAIEDDSHGVTIETAAASYRAARAVIATGGFAWFGDVLGADLDLIISPCTVLLAEVAENLIVGMPSLIYKPTDPKRHCYALPPIEYPDGRTYLKIARSFREGVFHSIEEIQDWFRSDGDANIASGLERDLAELMPDLNVGAVVTKPCVTTSTPTGHPYIDHVSPNVTTVLGGNGYAAKCAPAIGALAAMYAVDGTWLYPDIPRDLFKIRRL